MLAFAMCSHGLVETGDGHLRVMFSDHMTSLETLLEENMNFDNCDIIKLNTLKTGNLKYKYFSYLKANLSLQGFTGETQNIRYPGKVPYVGKN